VRVSGADYQRLGDAAPRVTQFIGNRCHILLLERRCVALSLGLDGRHCGCSLYASRPEPCRVLERGSVECVAVLERERLHAESTPSAR
jgi:Fe-S-cluster containining protein